MGQGVKTGEGSGSVQENLSRRERQIMDIIFSHGQATAGQIGRELPDPPAPGAVRTMLQILERRGHVTRYRKGLEFVYQPAIPKEQAAGLALERVLKVFFGGSFEKAVTAHLAEHAGEMSPDEFKRLSAIMRKAKGKGRRS